MLCLIRIFMLGKLVFSVPERRKMHLWVSCVKEIYEGHVPRPQGCALRKITRSSKVPNCEIQSAQRKAYIKKRMFIWSPKGKVSRLRHLGALRAQPWTPYIIRPYKTSLSGYWPSIRLLQVITTALIFIWDILQPVGFVLKQRQNKLSILLASWYSSVMI